ncbi:hypothetical protein ATY81_27510 [Rhizobium sp. R72]|nr:hypothetical protein ATY81_27510 [Rhizobium sp. R72]OWV97123.1 hypothetical protein ATY80_27510 [Rhizobium sp. R711]
MAWRQTVARASAAKKIAPLHLRLAGVKVYDALGRYGSKGAPLLGVDRSSIDRSLAFPDKQKKSWSVAVCSGA